MPRRPGRYIPLMLIPMWDPPLAAKEMERMAAKGVTAFAFSENPAPIGLPTIHDVNRYWDPVMATANELGMVASMHVGSSSQVPQIAPDSPFMANLAWGAIRTSGAMLSWLFSGMFQRYPNLKIALSEGEIGWMPYFLERAEQVLDKQRYWVMRGQKFMDHATTDVDLDTLNIRELFRNHVYGCFIEDHHGIASIDEIGEDNVMCETDYPHSDSTWPNCITAVKKVIGHLPAETQYKLLAWERREALPLHAGRTTDSRVRDGRCRAASHHDRPRDCASAAACASCSPPRPSAMTPRRRRSSSIRRETRWPTIEAAVEGCPTGAIKLVDQEGA